jgi:sec-independent protein translocase protein TatA
MASSIALLPNVGLPEILILLAIVILIFGPRRIPQAARSLGRGIRNFRESVSGEEKVELPEGETEATAGSEDAPAPGSPSKEEGKSSS